MRDDLELAKIVRPMSAGDKKKLMLAALYLLRHRLGVAEMYLWG